MRALPSGTVTFLFTDIEGSTRWWERHPAQMQVALARHDALLRQVIEAHAGHVFKTVGDAFCAAFPTATDAFAAARATQLRLASEPWPDPVVVKVRMALHSGGAEFRDGDYFGRALNRVARLLSAGHGGQVLLSRATAEQLGEALPGGATLLDLGERRLRDLIEPEHVYQLVDPALASQFPALRTLDPVAHNLPAPTTSFVGRERERADIKGLLASARLVTLTGAGGAGKTRLALQVATECVGDATDGTWYVPLAPLADPRLVPQAVAETLGIMERPGIGIDATLAAELRDREMLLVLDNGEHLLAVVAKLCIDLLSSSPRLRILATSREALRVAGEATYRVPSLATPAASPPAGIDELLRVPSVRLFVDRAEAVRPGFRPGDDDLPALARIARRLDGIPLAIELAAARVRMLSLDEIDRRLDRRFQLLTGGTRTALPRQQTLRSTIDWSYDMLGAAERALFARLSVFAGGFTLDAAEQVCAGEAVAAEDVLDLVTSLADKSLVQVQDVDVRARYGFLETVREYATERLREGGAQETWRGSHLRHFAAMVDAWPHRTASTSEQEDWLGRLDDEHENIRAALDWALDVPAERAAALRLVARFWSFWYMHGHLHEGRRRIADVLAATTGDDGSARASVLYGAGVLAAQQGDFVAARSHYRACVERARMQDNPGLTAGALGGLANIAAEQGDFAIARSLHEESLAMRRSIDDTRGVAASLVNLTLVSHFQGDHATSRRHGEEALALFRGLDDAWGIANALSNLALSAIDQGDLDRARRLSEESLEIRTRIDDRIGMGFSTRDLASVAARGGDVAAARALAAKALAIFTPMGERVGMAESHGTLSLAALRSGDAAEARLQQLAALRLFAEVGERAGLARSLDSLAEIEFALGEYGRVVCIGSAADRLRAAIGTPRSDADSAAIDGQRAAARAALDPATFDENWRAGQEGTLDDLVRDLTG
jgi:predicted ATPase/class 3 adenylate cyclase